MTVIEIPFDRIKECQNKQFMIFHHASNYAIVLKDWCKSQGLEMNKDFEWEIRSEERKIVFKFFNKAELYSSIFALKFGDGHG